MSENSGSFFPPSHIDGLLYVVVIRDKFKIEMLLLLKMHAFFFFFSLFLPKVCAAAKTKIGREKTSTPTA